VGTPPDATELFSERKEIMSEEDLEMLGGMLVCSEGLIVAGKSVELPSNVAISPEERFFETKEAVALSYEA